ncbi:MAG: hypothetical protein ACREPX_01690 [Rhodanobacteraceae bacterium]
MTGLERDDLAVLYALSGAEENVRRGFMTQGTMALGPAFDARCLIGFEPTEDEIRLGWQALARMGYAMTPAGMARGDALSRAAAH